MISSLGVDEPKLSSDRGAFFTFTKCLPRPISLFPPRPRAVRQSRQRHQGVAGMSAAHVPGSCASQETGSSKLGNLSHSRPEINGRGLGAHVTWDMGRPAEGRQGSLSTNQILPSVKTTAGWSGQSSTAWRQQRQRRTGAAYGTFVSRRDFWSFGR